MTMTPGPEPLARVARYPPAEPPLLGNSTLSPMRGTVSLYVGVMTIERLHHAAFTVTDLDAAIAFYGLLGFAPIERPDFGFPGAWLEAGQAQVHLLESADLPPSAGT